MTPVKKTPAKHEQDIREYVDQSIDAQRQYAENLFIGARARIEALEEEVRRRSEAYCEQQRTIERIDSDMAQLRAKLSNVHDKTNVWPQYTMPNSEVPTMESTAIRARVPAPTVTITGEHSATKPHVDIGVHWDACVLQLRDIIRDYHSVTGLYLKTLIVSRPMGSREVTLVPTFGI